jgi:hypothetical protein
MMVAPFDSQWGMPLISIIEAALHCNNEDMLKKGEGNC